jgi:hypothetical protein
MNSSDLHEFVANVTRALRTKYKSLSQLDDHTLMCMWAEGALPLPEPNDFS